MPDEKVKSFEKESFKRELLSNTLSDDQSFADAVYTAVSRFNIHEQLFRDAFGLSEGAVERWTTGKNLPQPVIRPKILQWIAEQL